jgi:hypothetical protein
MFAAIRDALNSGSTTDDERNYIGQLDFAGQIVRRLREDFSNGRLRDLTMAMGQAALKPGKSGLEPEEPKKLATRPHTPAKPMQEKLRATDQAAEAAKPTTAKGYLRLIRGGSND